MKLIPSIPQETDDVTSDFDNIVENAKDCGILFILLLGSSNVTTEIHRGVVIARPDFATSHEEADNIIVQQAVMCAKEKSNTIVVVADDTDVFVLLLYHYMKESLTSPMFMSSPVQRRSLIDIKGAVQIHQSIIPDLPAAHALSGCDTVATYFGIGKGTVLKNLIAAPNSLSQLGCLNAQLADVIDQSTQFIGACYGNRIKEKTMSDIRYRIWATKFGNGTTTAPQKPLLRMSKEPTCRHAFGKLQPHSIHLLLIHENTAMSEMNRLRHCFQQQCQMALHWPQETS